MHLEICATKQQVYDKEKYQKKQGNIQIMICISYFNIVNNTNKDNNRYT